MDRIKELSSYAYLAETISAGIDSGLISLIENNEEIPSSFDKKTVSLMYDVFIAGKIAVRDGERIQFTSPSYPFFSKIDILKRFFSSKGNLYDDIMKSLKMDKEDPLRNAPEPKWHKKRLAGIAISAITGEAFAVAKNSSIINPSGNLLDLGSGHGLYASAFIDMYPSLKVTASDLPEVVPIIKDILKKVNKLDRVNLLSLDFMKEDIPVGVYDSILCANILHEEKRERVLNNVYNALPNGGKIIIDSRVSDAPLTLEGAIKALSWHIRGKGNLISSKDYYSILHNLGFKNIKINAFYEIHCIISAEK